MLLCYRNPRLLTGKCLRDPENNIKMKGRWHKSSGSSPHGHQRSGLTHPSLAKAKTQPETSSITHLHSKGNRYLPFGLSSICKISQPTPLPPLRLSRRGNHLPVLFIQLLPKWVKFKS